ncbi:MAG: thiamine-phosphate kinase [Candidatus Omnitrophica bacterium]|nr:thiamine-phosphate kinase [Candidatus Omnitrophota bacterium]
MLINKIGEFALIEYFKKRIKVDSSVIKGIGDDCAVIRFKKDRYILFSSDMLVEGVDFQSNTPAYLIGRKSLGVVLSDIASCGGIPKYALLSLGFSPRLDFNFIKELLRGFLDLARKFKVNLVGGDLSRAENLTIDVSILGEVEKRFLVLREGAKKGDVIFVSGPLGGSIKKKHLRFIPRIKEARFLVKNFKINSMIDISDGLVQDLSHILKENNLSAVIYEDLIPLSAEAKGINSALYDGEDFELLFPVPLKEAKNLSKLKKFFPIGELTKGRNEIVLIKKNGKEVLLKVRGFRHF